MGGRRHAQTQGEITGIVSDAACAIIQGATVTISNTATGATGVAVSNDAGIHRFPTLPPGIYSLRIEASGFNVAVSHGVGGSPTLHTA